MKTYTWTVVRLECLPSTDIVAVVHWRATCTEAGHSVSVAGATALAVIEPVTPFAELTEPQAIGWVQEQLGVEAVEATEVDLSAQVDALATPLVIAPALPWAS